MIYNIVCGVNMPEHKEIPFVARDAEMSELKERISRRGMTVIAGRPQIGKSRLVKELLKELRGR